MHRKHSLMLKRMFTVHKVDIAICRGGSTSFYKADMVFMDDVPHVVLECWQGLPGDTPAVTIPLNPDYLHEFPKAPKWMYENTIQDDRSLS